MTKVSFLNVNREDAAIIVTEFILCYGMRERGLK